MEAVCVMNLRRSTSSGGCVCVMNWRGVSISGGGV